mgnify:CR=1 FL=1
MFRICLAIWVVALTTLVTSLAIVPMEESGMSIFCTSPCSMRLAALAFRLFGRFSFHGIIVEDNYRYGIEVIAYFQIAYHHIQTVGSQCGYAIEQCVGRYLHAGERNVLKQPHPYRTARYHSLVPMDTGLEKIAVGRDAGRPATCPFAVPGFVDGGI